MRVHQEIGYNCANKSGFMEVDLMKLCEAVKLYEADKKGMEKGKETESHGIEQRKKFLSIYPIESIPNLTIEQYVIGNDNSFSHWLRYELYDVASMGNARPAIFKVYTKKDTGSQIHLLSSYPKFGSNSEAFNFLKNEIVNFLEDIKQENYNNFKKYKIDSRVKSMLMAVYFDDRFVPVCTEGTIDDCLNRMNISFEKKATMVEKNLTLVKWKKTMPELADWSNQILLDFCRWLKEKNINIDKEELCNNAVIEKEKKIEEAKKIEEEIASLNLDGDSQKAIVKVRVNQGIFRNDLLKRYNRCCLCDVKVPALLIASHIKPWAESEPKEKLDVDNGFLMCPNHDKLFDKGYITFDDNGKIIIFDELPENDKELLNIDSRKHIELTEDNKKYLKFHRENVFKNKLKF